MQRRMTLFDKRRRSLSCSSLPTISEVASIGDLTCEATRRKDSNRYNDHSQISILYPVRDPQKELLLLREKEAMSVRPIIVRENPTKDGNVNETETINEERHSSSETILGNIEKRSCGDSKIYNDHDQQNDRFQRSTADLSNGKNLAEFLRIEEIVSATVSKHLEKLSAALLGKGKPTDASHNGAVAEKRESNAREFHEGSHAGPVLHTQSGNKAKQYEESGAQLFKSRYHYAPTQDRMSVLAQKYLGRYSANGVAEVAGRGEQTQVVSEVGFRHGERNSNVGTLDSSKHCCSKKADFQGVHGKNFHEGDGLTGVQPVCKTQINHPQTGQPAATTNPENTNPRLSAARNTDIKANIIHNPAGFCFEKTEPSIQHSKISTSQTEDQSARITRDKPNVPSSNYRQDHPSTIMQPALLMSIPVIQHAPSAVLHYNPPGESLYSDLVKMNEGYLMKSENEDPQFPENKQEVRIVTKTTACNGCLKSQTQFSKSRSETKIAEQTTPHNRCLSNQIQFTKNSSDVKNAKQVTSNDRGLRSETQLSKNSSEVKISQQTTPYNEYLRNLTQFSQNSPEVKIAEPTTVNNGCLKSQTNFSGNSSDVTTAGKTTPNNGGLKSKIPLANKTRTQDTANKSNPHGAKENENPVGKLPTNVQLKKRSLPDLTMISKMSVGVSGSPDGHAHKPSVLIQRCRTLSEVTHGSVNCAEKRSHFHGNLIQNKGSPASYKLKESNTQTSADGKCFTRRSSTKEKQSYPIEPRFSLNSQTPRMSPVSPRSASPHSYSAPFLGNQKTLRKPVSTTAELLEKYRISGLFCEKTSTREKLRITSRTKDPTRNKPVVASPHSGKFVPGKESPAKECRFQINPKAAAVSGSRLQRSASLNDISMKQKTSDGNVSFTKSTSEKIRELSSSLGSLVDKVSNISKNALMRHKQSMEEFDGFLEMSRASSLENLKNRSWKSMDNLLMPEDPVETPSFLFCKHLEAERLKSFSTSIQDWSPGSLMGDNDVFFPAMETNGDVLDTSVQTSNPSPVRRVPESKDNSRNCAESSTKYMDVRQARGSCTASGVCNDRCNKADKVSWILSAETAKERGDLLSDISVRKEIIGTSGSLMDHFESSKTAVQNTEEFSEPEEHEMRTSRTSKDPNLAKTPLRVIVTSCTSGKVASPETASRGSTTSTSESFKRSKSLQVSHGLQGTTGDSKTTRIVRTPGTLAQQGAVIRRSELSKTPGLEKIPGASGILGGSRTSEAAHLPERNGIVGVSRTSRTPEVTDLPERNGIVGTSRTSRTPEVTYLPERDGIVGASRTSRAPEVTDRPGRNGIVVVSGASVISRKSVLQDNPARYEAIGMSGTTGKSEVSGKAGRTKTMGLAGNSRNNSSVRPKTGTPGSTGVPGSAGTPGTSVRPKSPGTPGSSGTPGTSVSPRTSGRSEKSGHPRTPGSSGTPGLPGTSGSSGSKEKTNEEAWVTLGASRTPEELSKSKVQNETQKGGERKHGVEKTNRGKKSFPVRNSLRKNEKGDVRLPCGELEKPCDEKSGKSDWNSETVVGCEAQVTGMKYTDRKYPNKETRSDDYNSGYKSNLAFGECENISIALTKIATTSSSPLNEIQDNTQFLTQQVNHGRKQRLSSVPVGCHGNNVRAPQSIRPSTGDVITERRRNGEENIVTGKETPRRRKGIFEAPEELRARFISQEEVNRLKMCFLSVQRQNNKNLGQDTTSLRHLSCSAMEERLNASDDNRTDKRVLQNILQLLHDEFAFDGYLNDGVEDVKMAGFVISHGRRSERDLRDAVRQEFKDLYWKDKLVTAMYTAIHDHGTASSSPARMSPAPQQLIETSRLFPNMEDKTHLKTDPQATMTSYPPYSMSRSGSERSSSSGEGCAVPLSDQNLDFAEILPFGLDDIGDVKNDLTTIFNDYHRNIGVFLATTINVLVEKLPGKIKEVQQQINYERRLKRRSWKAYLKLMNNPDFGTKETKEMDGKLRCDMEEIEWKIAYLRNVKRKLKNIYAERFGLDGYLLQSFIEQFSSTYISLHPYIENNHLIFSSLWDQRHSVIGPDDIYESRKGAELLHGTENGLLAYLFARYAMTQGYIKYFLYTYRYCVTSHRLLGFIQEKYVAAVRVNDSNQQTVHQLQIQYRALDLLAEWIDDYFDVDFKCNETLCQELTNFLTQEVITTDKSDRGNLLLQMLADKRPIISTCLSLHSHGLTNQVSLDDLRNIELSERESAVDENSNKKKSKANGINNKCLPHHFSDCETSILDYPDQMLAEQLSLIQQDLFHRLHPIHFFNTRSLGVGISRYASPNTLASHKDVILGFSAGLRRGSSNSSESNTVMHFDEPENEIIEETIEHAQDISLWISGEICGMASVKGQLALITKFINVAYYCQEIRNFETAIQIVDALEMIVVRQLPVWKQVSTKTFEILDDLKAVKVLLKTDASWLIQGDAFRRRPTIPSVLLFIIHVQQEELGGFLLANGMYKWTKLRSIARLVDQIHAFKELKYSFLPNEELQHSIKRRIVNLKDQNLHLIASENPINFHAQRPSSNSKKLKNALERMRTSFG